MDVIIRDYQFQPFEQTKVMTIKFQKNEK